MPDVELKPQVYKDPRPAEYFNRFHALVRDEETDLPSGRQLPALLERAGVAGVHFEESPTPAPAGPVLRN